MTRCFIGTPSLAPRRLHRRRRRQARVGLGRRQRVLDRRDLLGAPNSGQRLEPDVVGAQARRSRRRRAVRVAGRASRASRRGGGLGALQGHVGLGCWGDGRARGCPSASGAGAACSWWPSTCVHLLSCCASGCGSPPLCHQRRSPARAFYPALSSGTAERCLCSRPATFLEQFLASTSPHSNTSTQIECLLANHSAQRESVQFYSLRDAFRIIDALRAPNACQNVQTAPNLRLRTICTFVQSARARTDH